MNHTCHFPTCTRQVPPRFWGCKRHWFKLPLRLRRKIWATYRPGQEDDKVPSPGYVEAAKEVRQWCLENPYMENQE